MQPTLTVTTVTNQYLAPRWTDIVLRSNAFFGKIMTKTERWKGSQMLEPIKYQKGVSSVAFNGFDLLPITQQPQAVNMTFYATFVATNVALAKSDIALNDTLEKKLDLIRVTMESRAQDAADDIGNFLQGDGTSYSGKAPMGLAGIIDDGSTLSSYGGLSRASYSGLNSTVTASGGTISLVKVRTLWNSIADDPVIPDYIITDYTTWGYFEQLQTPFQRNNMDFRPDDRQVSQVSGYSELRWDGMIVARDKKIKSGDFDMLNMRFLNWYALKFPEGQTMTPKAVDIEGNVYEDTKFAPRDAFSWTKFIPSYNQLAYNGFMVLGGQLYTTAPFRHGKLTGITGV